jgi:hypothetical protein
MSVTVASYFFQNATGAPRCPGIMPGWQLVIESNIERFRIYLITALRCRGRAHR